MSISSQQQFEDTADEIDDVEELLVLHEFNRAGESDNELAALTDDDQQQQHEEEEDEGGDREGGDGDIDLDEVVLDEPPTHGIVVIGKIINAYDLHVTPSSRGKLFFKILFSAETSRAATFRCKTPMFTSTSIPLSLNPVFDNSFFKFETILPMVLNGSNNERNANRLPYGEIIISLMCINDNGVQQTLGDVCFDLSELAMSGTTVYSSSSQMDVRAVEGSYPIISKGSAAASGPPSELCVSMRVGWNSEDFKPTINVVPSNQRRSSNSIAQGSVAGSRADSRTRGSVAARTTAVTGLGKGALPSIASGSGTAISKGRSDSRGRPTSASSNADNTRGREGGEVSKSPTSRLNTTKSKAGLTTAKSSKTITIDRPASAGGPMTVKRHHDGIGMQAPKQRVASRLDRKMYFEQKRIDAENAAMLKRMQKNGKVTTTNEMYSAQAKKVVAALAANKSGTIAGGESKSNSPSRSRSHSPGQHQPQQGRASVVMDEKTLLEMYNKLKKSTADMQLENNSLRARVNKAKLLITKYESSLSKMKKRGVPDSVLGVAAMSVAVGAAEAKTSTIGSVTKTKQQQQHKAEVKGSIAADASIGEEEGDKREKREEYDAEADTETDAFEGTAAEKSKHLASKKKDSKGDTTRDDEEEEEEGRDETEDVMGLVPSAGAMDVSAIAFVDTDYVTGLPIDVTSSSIDSEAAEKLIASFKDKELADLTEEYFILQQMRKSLLQRIKQAKSTLQTAVKKAKVLSANSDSMKERLAAHLSFSMSPSDDSNNTTLSHVRPSVGGAHSNHANHHSNSDKNKKGTHNKLHSSIASVGQHEQQQPGSTISPELRATIVNELNLIKQIREIELEIETLQTLHNNLLLSGSIGLAIVELTGSLNLLRDKYQLLKQEYDRVRYEKDLYLNKYKRLSDDFIVLKLRDSIATIRSRLCSIKMKERLKRFEVASEAIDIELLRKDLGQANDIDALNQKLNAIKEDEH